MNRRWEPTRWYKALAAGESTIRTCRPRTTSPAPKAVSLSGSPTPSASSFSVRRCTITSIDPSLILLPPSDRSTNTYTCRECRESLVVRLTRKDRELSISFFDIDAAVDRIVVATDCLHHGVVPCRSKVSCSLEHLATVGVGVELRLTGDVSVVAHDDLFTDVVIDRDRSDGPFDFHVFPIVVDTDLLTWPVVEDDHCCLDTLRLDTSSRREMSVCVSLSVMMWVNWQRSCGTDRLRCGRERSKDVGTRSLELGSRVVAGKSLVNGKEGMRWKRTRKRCEHTRVPIEALIGESDVEVLLQVDYVLKVALSININSNVLESEVGKDTTWKREDYSDGNVTWFCRMHVSLTVIFTWDSSAAFSLARGEKDVSSFIGDEEWKGEIYGSLRSSMWWSQERVDWHALSAGIEQNWFDPEWPWLSLKQGVAKIEALS